MRDAAASVKYVPQHDVPNEVAPAAPGSVGGEAGFTLGGGSKEPRSCCTSLREAGSNGQFEQTARNPGNANADVTFGML